MSLTFLKVIEQIMIEFGLNFNPAFSCCLSDELRVSKVLEASCSRFRAHVPSDPPYCNTACPMRTSTMGP